MTKWEYRVVYLIRGLGGGITAEKEQDELNSLGEQGWELVSVSAILSDYTGETVRAYLKRRLQE